jgi:hypothetical protein
MFGGLRSAKAVVSETRSRLDPTAMAYGSGKEPVHNGHQPLGRTITSLKRWSVLNKELPGWHTKRLDTGPVQLIVFSFLHSCL